jgi:hypothetical protein
LTKSDMPISSARPSPVASNPKNWSLSDMQSMMKQHLDLTLKEAVDRLQGHFAADIADYDQVHLEILAMADMLSSGIIAQFPEKFAHAAD